MTTALRAVHGLVVALTAWVGVFVPGDLPHWDFSDSNNSFYLGW